MSLGVEFELFKFGLELGFGFDILTLGVFDSPLMGPFREITYSVRDQMLFNMLSFVFGSFHVAMNEAVQDISLHDSATRRVTKVSWIVAFFYNKYDLCIL